MLSTPFSTKAVRRQYSQIFNKSKYIPAQTTFRQLSDKLNYIYIIILYVIIIINI